MTIDLSPATGGGGGGMNSDKTDEWDFKHAQHRVIEQTETGFVARDKLSPITMTEEEWVNNAILESLNRPFKVGAVALSASREWREANAKPLPASTAEAIREACAKVAADEDQDIAASGEHANWVARQEALKLVELRIRALDLSPFTAPAESGKDIFHPATFSDDKVIGMLVEDVAVYAKPLHPRRPHFIDELLALDDNRLVGIQFWVGDLPALTAPAEPSDAEVEAAEEVLQSRGLIADGDDARAALKAAYAVRETGK